jgi:hypothetical protein
MATTTEWFAFSVPPGPFDAAVANTPLDADTPCGLDTGCTPRTTSRPR